jgi:hypothetical protein
MSLWSIGVHVFDRQDLASSYRVALTWRAQLIPLFQTLVGMEA